MGSSIRYFRIWRIPSLGMGCVITLHEHCADGQRDTREYHARTVVGWTVPGSSQYLTRDLDDVSGHILSGHYGQYEEIRDDLMREFPELFSGYTVR